MALMPYPPSRLARVSPTGPAPTISTLVSKGVAVEPFWDEAVEVMMGPRRLERVGDGAGCWCQAVGRLPAQQEVEVDLVEGLRVLVLGPVTAVLHHRELRAGDQRRDPLCLGDRPRRVLCGPQHQSRGLDPAEGLVGEHVALADLQVLQG